MERPIKMGQVVLVARGEDYKLTKSASVKNSPSISAQQNNGSWFGGNGGGNDGGSWYNKR
jgi:hypothetical protein